MMSFGRCSRSMRSGTTSGILAMGILRPYRYRGSLLYGRRVPTACAVATFQRPLRGLGSSVTRNLADG